jgi:hypothetical protein
MSSASSSEPTAVTDHRRKHRFVGQLANRDHREGATVPPRGRGPLVCGRDLCERRGPVALRLSAIDQTARSSTSTAPHGEPPGRATVLCDGARRSWRAGRGGGDGSGLARRAVVEEAHGGRLPQHQVVREQSDRGRSWAAQSAVSSDAWPQTRSHPWVIVRGHAFMHNLRRGHYELGFDARAHRRVAVAFTELAQVI